MRKVIQILVAATITVSTVARAEPPNPDEAKKVYEFVEHGQGQGIVLEDARLCAEIPKNGEHRSECTQELTDGIPAGSKIYVWVAYLVPKGDTVADVSVQVKQDDKVRETKDLDKLEGHGYLAHTWTMFTARKAGLWSAVIARGDKTLKTLTIKVGD
jgi:hypothetical protein